MKTLKLLIAFTFFSLLLFAPLTTRAAVMPATVRIGLVREFGNRESIPISNTRIHVGQDVGGLFVPHITLQHAAGFEARVNGAGQVVIWGGGLPLYTFAQACTEPIIVCADGGFVSLGGTTYRGMIALRVYQNRLTAINIVCPEYYLKGVIPAEMPHTWHMNALKAQTIAARTYMVRRSLQGPHAHQGFDLCDTECCQVYRGVAQEQLRTSQAVTETRGLLIFYGDQVIEAVYFSSSGGATDNSENVWVATRPYLRSVNSIAEHEPLQWTRTFTWAQISTLLTNAGANIGPATGMAVTQTSSSGRVQQLTIFGTTGQHVLQREGIRSFFGPQGGWLASRMFSIIEALPTLPTVTATNGVTTRTGPLSSFMGLDSAGHATPMFGAYIFDGHVLRRMEPTPAVAAGGAGVTLTGSGWGHGVGMSQRGAEGMARLGYTYRQILQHYYTGVEIR